MTIQKAIKLGKPFRRKAHKRKFPGEWYVRRRIDVSGKLDHYFYMDYLTTCDILAVDWEVKP